MANETRTGQARRKVGRPKELTNPKGFCIALGSDHRRMVREFKSQNGIQSETAAIRKMIEVAAGESGS